MEKNQKKTEEIVKKRVKNNKVRKGEIRKK